MICTAGTELSVVTRSGDVHRCRACVGHASEMHGPCPVEERCFAAYRSDWGYTSRLQNSYDPSKSTHTRLIVHPGAPVSAFDQQVKDVGRRSLTVVIAAEEGDSVSFDNAAAILDRSVSAMASVELWTTLMAKEMAYMNILRRCDPTVVSVVAELRTYEVPFDWYHFVGRVMMTKQRGFKTRVVIPLHPAQAAAASVLKHRLSAKGLSVEFDVHPSYADDRETLMEMATRPCRLETAGGFEQL